MNLLHMENISKSYKKNINVIDNFNLSIKENQVVGLVGESGCGKSTIASILMKLENINNGRILFESKNITNLKTKEIKSFRSNVQIVFQNVVSSLNPKMNVLEIISEPLRNFTNLNKEETKYEVCKILKKVGLNDDDLYKYPKEFSGGQRQRISIARAIVIKPKLIVFDEATSSLDVSIQADILNLLIELKDSYNLSYLFISHDLGVVRYISDIVYVMYLGENIEIIDSSDLLEKSKHPYTRLLLESVPIVGRKNLFEKLEDTEENCVVMENGCKFYNRCKQKKEICFNNKPIIKQVNDKHYVACHLI